ncbi:BH0509 family protein [Priestia koreensis]|uniref:Transporter n=1 Tax=Priestia koreensis TaxID=284581 RepID=A0A0M0KQJ1_9BACI|nr:BH0509 family protein [Priestia koreensis]KOO41080.1 transporter [Priestia koreensis]
MSRQERKNMITFIERMKGMDRDSLLYMTDAEIEHIYNSAYSLSEEGRDF